MAVISMKELLESGVHFGHQTRKWNPKMAEYIFTDRNGIHIIDLKKTLSYFNEAYNFIKQTVSDGGDLLLVGTKKQAQEVIASEAEKAGVCYVNERWLGGMLTNFQTIRLRVDRLEEIEAMEEDDSINLRPKKEIIRIRKEYEKLKKYLWGIKQMKKLPQVLFVVGPKKEEIAIKEARKLKIKVVGIVDTNCDPDMVDYCIPANDDAIKSIKLLVGRIADAVLAGKAEQLEGAQADIIKEEDSKEEVKVEEIKTEEIKEEKPVEEIKTEEIKEEKPVEEIKTEEKKEDK